MDGVEEPGAALRVLESPDKGGSRSSGLGVGCARMGREDSGAGLERGSRLRSGTAVASEVHVPAPDQLGVSWPLRGTSRAYWRFWFWVYAGEVGEGCAMELGETRGPLPRDAVRCEEAATAAAEGSREE